MARYKRKAPTQRQRALILRSALRAAQEALNNWTVTYADDMCSEKSVKEAWHQISEGGGTLAYISNIQTRIDHALSY